MHWIIEKEFQKNIYFCFIDYAKAFDCVDHNNLWKILQEMGIPHHLTCLLRNLFRKQQLETDMEQWTDSKLRKKYIKDVYRHSPYLTSLQSTSCEMPGWMNHKLESCRENINNLRYTDDTTLMAESQEELKSLLMTVKEESETKTMVSGPIT